MIAIKNIVLTIFFMTYLIIIVNGARTSESNKKCLSEIYTSFGYETNKYQYRNTIPKIAFQYKLYDMLAGGELHNISQQYFKHIYDLLHAKDETQNLKQWCGNNYTAFNDCYEKLRVYFRDSNNPTEILKHAYSHLTVDSFSSNNYMALSYFKYLMDNLDCIDGEEFLTPTEICQGKTSSIQRKEKNKSCNIMNKFETQQCTSRLHNSFGVCDNKRYQLRNTIPKLAFQYKLYSMFSDEGLDFSIEQKYFLHIYGLLHANEKTNILKPWCKENFYDPDGCYNQLRKYFLDSNDTTEILKHAFANLAYGSFKPDDYEAHKYFLHLLSNLECIIGEEFMTPTEICQGKTKAAPRTYSYNKKRTEPDSEAESQSSSSKNQRTAFIETSDDSFYSDVIQNNF